MEVANESNEELFFAVTEGSFDKVVDLVNRGADLGKKNKYGYPPLHWAAMCGDFSMVQFLIDKGADIHQRDDEGNEPVRWAIEYGDQDMVDLLSEKGAAKEKIAPSTAQEKLDVSGERVKKEKAKTQLEGTSVPEHGSSTSRVR